MVVVVLWMISRMVSAIFKLGIGGPWLGFMEVLLAVLVTMVMVMLLAVVVVMVMSWAVGVTMMMAVSWALFVTMVMMMMMMMAT